MASVHSVWASTIPSISGTFTAGEWTSAGTLPMPGGFIMVKNDANYLYLALDLVADTGNTPGVGDYFWLTFDNDRNATITPNFDVNYGIYPSLPIKIGRQNYLGPGAWTGILGGLSSSATAQGFSATPNSATPHRIWEIRVALSEIGVASLASMILPYVRFGLRVSSSSPAITTDFPPNFFTNFLNLHEIYLATGPVSIYPPGTAGPVIGGVGLIPFTTISGGRATTAAPYVPTVTNAAFGGTLNFIYNRPTITALWGAGARKYLVKHRFGTSGAFTDMRKTWVNYRWTGTTYVLDSFGPAADDTYPLMDPAFDYSTKDLLFQWDTAGGGEPTGTHQFQVEFQTAAGAVVVAPPQTLEVYVDNAAPDLQLYELTYKGATLAPCSIVTITETADPVKIHFRAFDAQGDLLAFSMYAYFGGPLTAPMNLLPAGMGSYPGGLWGGVADQVIDCPMTTSGPIVPVFPPYSCAYQIRLSAWPRVTNGYGYIGYNEATTHVTFIRPGKPPFAVPKRLVAPFGFKPNPENLFLIKE